MIESSKRELNGNPRIAHQFQESRLVQFQESVIPSKMLEPHSTQSYILPRFIFTIRLGSMRYSLNTFTQYETKTLNIN